jgi:glycosyltransferase involved in cell wall biosynthesis
MAERIKLGLVFKYDEAWIAGSYYTLNLIHALKTLPDEEQPQIILFTDRAEDRKKVEEIGYHYLSHRQYIPQFNFIEKLLNKISRKLNGKNIIEKRMRNHDVDFVFMQRRSWETDLLEHSKKIFWIPDCQELIMPELFFKRELDGRKHVYNEIIQAGSKILFSSNTAREHFQSFYPQATNMMYVVNFAVIHPSLAQVDVQSLKKTYNLSSTYFLAPNQFWVHKNHQVVLDAALRLKEQNIPVQIVFTGKENDFRAPEYTNQLKQFVIDKGLSEQVKFLGFIPREHQLCLMNNCRAVIQPSLFEGWSTVVEDAKALNKWVILSDIAVHREQLSINVDFFNPKDSIALSKLIELHIANERKVAKRDYHFQLKKFGKGFLEMLKHP